MEDELQETILLVQDFKGENTEKDECESQSADNPKEGNGSETENNGTVSQIANQEQDPSNAALKNCIIVEVSNDTADGKKEKQLMLIPQLQEVIKLEKSTKLMTALSKSERRKRLRELKPKIFGSYNKQNDDYKVRGRKKRLTKTKPYLERRRKELIEEKEKRLVSLSMCAKNSKDFAYKCIEKGCKQHFNTANSLRLHIEESHKEPDEQLQYLLDNANAQEAALNYKVIPLRSKRMSCPECGHTFLVRYAGLLGHVTKCHKNHANYRQLFEKCRQLCQIEMNKLNAIEECSLCHESMSNILMPIHLQQDHCETDEAKQILAVCLDWKEKKSKKYELKRSKEPLQCRFCKETFKYTTSYGIRSHEKNCRNNPDRVPLISCKCGLKMPFMEEEKMNEHKAKCEKMKPKDYICELCGRICKAECKCNLS